MKPSKSDTPEQIKKIAAQARKQQRLNGSKSDLGLISDQILKQKTKENKK